MLRPTPVEDHLFLETKINVVGFEGGKKGCNSRCAYAPRVHKRCIYMIVFSCYLLRETPLCIKPVPRYIKTYHKMCPAKLSVFGC